MKPHEQIAQLYMQHKGYPNIEPVDVEELDGAEPCWYFIYELPEGTLELEVYWDNLEWQTNVTAFNMPKPDPHA